MPRATTGVRTWKEFRKELFTPEEIEQIDEEVRNEVLAMDLRVLRQAMGKTQAELAPALELTQSDLSKLERKDDHRVSIVRKYVEALGGQLEITAVIGNARIPLRGV